MEGFKIIVTKDKRKRIPIKRQSVYRFLESTINKNDVDDDLFDAGFF